MGIALDGDGDKFLYDAEANVLDGDEALFIIAEARMQSRSLVDGVVGTVMTNLGLEEALRERGGCTQAREGWRPLRARNHERGWLDSRRRDVRPYHLPRPLVRGGIVAALQVLAAGAQRCDARRTQVGETKYLQLIRNVRMRDRIEPMEIPEVVSAVRDAETRLGDQGRVLLRPSGTEPVVRVMVEGREAGQVSAMTDELAEAVSAAIGAD